MTFAEYVPNETEMCNVAAYGTLRSNERNECVWFGNASARKGQVFGWRLYQPRNLFFPIAFETEDESDELIVDLLTPRDNYGFTMMRDFDRLESCPELFTRKIVNVIFDDGDVRSAWIYSPRLQLPFWLPAQHIKDGDWSSFRRSLKTTEKEKL